MTSFAARPESLWKARGFRTLLVVSGASHVLVAVGLLVAPRSYSKPAPPMPVFVEVMAAVPSAPAPAPAPAPRQQVEEAVVIPDVPSVKPKPKPKPKPEPPKEPPKEPAREEPVPSTEDLMAALREDAEARPDPEQPAGGSGTLDPEVAAYIRRVKACVYANWVGARSYQRRPNLSVLFRVEVTAGGVVDSVELSQSSGIRALDETAERAIYKCSPLDSPPGGASLIPMRFVPGELE